MGVLTSRTVEIPDLQKFYVMMVMAFFYKRFPVHLAIIHVMMIFMTRAR